MWLYRTLFAFDALVLLVLAYFFFDGLQYSSGAEFLTLWLPILAVPIAVLAGAAVLRSKGRTGLATLLLACLALPPLLYVAFFALLLIANPSWH